MYRAPLVASAAGVGALSAVTTGLLAVGWRWASTVSKEDVFDNGAKVTYVEPSTVDRCDVAIQLKHPDFEHDGFASFIQDGRIMMLSPPVENESGNMVRHVCPLDSEPSGVEVGMFGTFSFDPWKMATNPLDVDWQNLSLETDTGDIQVETSGQSKRAVVFIHGRSGFRTTGWWYVPTATQEGWQTVMAAYRNDVDAPQTGRYLFGGEWVDLIPVLDSLSEDGVQEVVLVGWSMGGNIAASYLRERERSPKRYRHHPQVKGLVLDSAALSWKVVFKHAAKSRRLPGFMAAGSMAFGQTLKHVDWRDLNHLDDPQHLSMPVLIYHSDDDDVVPYSISQELHDSLQDSQLETFSGGRHCRSVNVDPERYLETFRQFLRTV